MRMLCFDTGVRCGDRCLAETPATVNIESHQPVPQLICCPPPHMLRSVRDLIFKDHPLKYYESSSIYNILGYCGNRLVL